MLQEPEPPAELIRALAEAEDELTPQLLGILTRYAVEGRPEAQRVLGLAHAKGEGVPQSFEVAVELFRRAALQGDADAQYYLGYAYLTGSGVEVDQVQALAWFILGASRGQTEAAAERDRGLDQVERTTRQAAVELTRMLGPEVQAGWSRDPASGIEIWLPSWYRNGSVALKVEVPSRDGRAHGRGRVILEGRIPGQSSREYEGHFHCGYYHGDQVREEEVHYLPTDDYLLRLPDSVHGICRDIAFWLRKDFGKDFATDPCAPTRGQTEDLLALVPEAFPTFDDAAARVAMLEAFKLHNGLCPGSDNANVALLPPVFGRARDRFGQLVFSPQLASARLRGMPGENPVIEGFENHAREARELEELEAEELRERAAAKRQAKADAAAAKRAETEAESRGSFDVHGLRLGMTVTEIRALLAEEVGEWERPWDWDPAKSPFVQPKREVRLNDGARITAHFTSTLNGSVLFAIEYRQGFRKGPRRDEMVAELEAKYGKPDDTGFQGENWGYKLVGRGEERYTAYLAASFLVDRTSGRVYDLRLTLKDDGFGEDDARAALIAEREAKRSADEASEPDES